MPVARFVVASFLACCLAGAARAQVRIERVWPGARTDESFTRLAHFFGGSTVEPRVFRSQPAARSGYYWSVRYEGEAAEPAAFVHLDVIAPGQREPQRTSFPLAAQAGTQSLLVGLTGGDWPALDQHPIAWRVLFTTADGRELAAQASFLWSAADTPRSGPADAAAAPVPSAPAPALPPS